MRVSRSRGALSGIALVVLGIWTALIPFVGPYFNFAITPAPNSAWYWTAGRGWLEVLPGAVAFVAGVLLLAGTNRVNLTFASWLGVASGAWLIVGPILSPRISLNAGGPDPASSAGVQTLEALLFFFAVGAAILFFAATALGRTSVHSVRDARSAARRAEADAAREAEERRLAERRLADERAERDREAAASRGTVGTGATAGATAGHALPEEGPRHERPVEGQPVEGQPVEGQPSVASSGQYRVQHDGVTETRQYPPVER
jgi:hypothetical protein